MPRDLHDSFGNPIDPEVGYARGRILADTSSEAQRLRQAQQLASNRVREQGREAVAVFTGNSRDFPLKPGDADTLCEEWIGAGLVQREFEAAVLGHLGGRPGQRAAALNRTTAGIIAAVAALSEGRPVLSIAPDGCTAHPSVGKGCRLAQVPLLVRTFSGGWQEDLEEHRPALVVVTTVTSRLQALTDAQLRQVTAGVAARRAVCLLDDAYGARIRPILHGGAASLACGAPLAITNCDKAGLSGPRCGLLGGDAVLVGAVAAKASSWGMEARAPIVTGALRALQRFDPADLVLEARQGKELCDALQQALGADRVVATDLGPLLHEDTVLQLLLKRAPAGATVLVPCEAAALVGMLLLGDHGIVTTNTHGQPGASASLRLKPTRDALARAGGVHGVVTAVQDALAQAAALLLTPPRIRSILLGDAGLR